jgi:hypothetical protein
MYWLLRLRARWSEAEQVESRFNRLIYGSNNFTCSIQKFTYRQAHFVKYLTISSDCFPRVGMRVELDSQAGIVKIETLGREIICRR